MLERAPSGSSEDRFRDALSDYLEKVLHVDVSLAAWPGTRNLPTFLGRAYTFYTGQIGPASCLFMAAPQGGDQTPAEIAKHLSRAAEAFDGPIVYAAPSINATFRTRLIEAGAAFAAPGNQLYIPVLAMDLREHFKAPKADRAETLSPSAQAVLFYYLLHNAPETELTPTEIAAPLRYSTMTIGRAFDELASVRLARVERRGRRKQLHFAAEGQFLIDMAKTLLVSPVGKRHSLIWRDVPPDLPAAGLTGLGALTDLSPPRVPVFAAAAEQFREWLSEEQIKLVDDEYAAEAVVETWRYDPRSLSGDHVVDPLSLYAEFWNADDERIAGAAETLLERWT